MKRIDELPLLSVEEIARRLKKLRRRPGEQLVNGVQPPTMKCIEKFTGIAHCTVHAAMHGRAASDGRSRTGPTSPHTILTLSHFFHRYDAGEISFTFEKGSGWQIHFHPNPEPRVQTVGQVTIGEGGPKLGFTRLNRDWV